MAKNDVVPLAENTVFYFTMHRPRFCVCFISKCFNSLVYVFNLIPLPFSNHGKGGALEDIYL